MEWREFLKTKFYEGDKIWICDYRFKNRYVDKPIRHIKPTKVMIRSNSDLPKNKRIYYSDWHFNGLNKADEPLKSKIIAPFDNTGYRQFTGTPVHVFLTEEEAQEHYKERCKQIKIGVEVEMKSIIHQYSSIVTRLDGVING